MFSFRELTLDDLDAYVHKVGQELERAEFVTRDEYIALSKENSRKEFFKSWVMFDDRTPHEWIGWCALASPSSSYPGAMHFYGGVIFDPYKAKGYSKLLYDFRFKAFPDAIFTVSILKTRILSMKIAESHGFKRFSEDEKGYVELVRLPSPILL